MDPDDYEIANAASAAEIAYLKELQEDQKKDAVETAGGAALQVDTNNSSILDQIMSTKKTINLLDSFMKLSIEDLKQCQLQQGDAQGPHWTLIVNDGLCLQLRLVWLQGDIVYDFPDFFILRDMTEATCKVLKTQSTTMSSDWMATGVYCSVMGQLREAGDSPQVVALKLTDMTDNNNEVIRTMWPLEIHQLKSMLAKDGKIECDSSESSSSSCSCTSSCSCSDSESQNE
ncbi:uncharacterized protein LOC132202029 [Neocloeon triangulifer]|uniref:uncharacterized protein LOC132202029 n=1 Tax=Neocloeon triangulifer TaxID=2078957 RepID=UPI00286F062F|nr:uncharacterized protein LOC132202029 [Neocloeon triangulifer]XP_059484646.1 uncharacterized protein LOC132202029 [Neocloeon triangulifer]